MLIFKLFRRKKLIQKMKLETKNINGQRIFHCSELMLHQLQ